MTSPLLLGSNPSASGTLETIVAAAATFKELVPTPLEAIPDLELFIDARRPDSRVAVVVASDDATGANSTTSLATRTGWTVDSGSWGINGNRIYSSSGSGSARFAIGQGSARGSYRVIGKNVFGTAVPQFSLSADATNEILVFGSNTTVSLRATVGGAAIVTSTTSVARVDGAEDTYDVRFLDDGTIELYWNGTLSCTIDTLTAPQIAALDACRWIKLYGFQVAELYGAITCYTSGVRDGLSCQAPLNLSRSGAATVDMATAAQRPIWRAGSGDPYFDFASLTIAGGANAQGWTVTLPTNLARDDMSVFFVVQPVTTGGDQYLYSINNSATAGTCRIGIDGRYCAFGNNAGHAHTGMPVPVGSPSIVGSVHESAALATSRGNAEGVGVTGIVGGRRYFDDGQCFGGLTALAVTSLYIGGLNATQRISAFTGRIKAVAVFKRALSKTERRQVVRSLGVRWPGCDVQDPARSYVFDGDSIMAVSSDGSLETTLLGAEINAALPYRTKVAQLGVVGQTLAQMAADFATQVAPLYDATLERNIYVEQGGTNDISELGTGAGVPALIYARKQAIHAAAKAAGFKTVTSTILPRGSTAIQDTTKAINALILADHSYADALVDPTASTIMGGFYRTFADGTTASNATVTSVTGAFTQDDVGKNISGGTIPAATKIKSVESATSLTLTANATGTASGVSITIDGSNTRADLYADSIHPTSKGDRLYGRYMAAGVDAID